MPQVSDRFGPFPVSVILDGAGNGQVSFQAVGANLRITNGYASCSSAVNQAKATAYKGTIIAAGSIVSSTESGSTGAAFSGPFDLLDGETLTVRWTGGDPGATATATFTGRKIPFSDVQGSEITWENIFAANDGAMVFPALHSPDYVPGVSGWTINRDGSYEFGEGGTFRGDLSVTSPSGSYVIVFADAVSGRIALQPPDSPNPGVTFTPGQIFTDSAGDLPELVLGGPGIGAGTVFGQIIISATTTESTIALNADHVTVGPAGGEIGRGLFNYAGSTVDSAANTTEQVVLTLPSKTYLAGRLYEVKVTGRIAPAGAANPLMQVRKTNIAGAVEFVLGRVTCQGAQEYAPPSSVFFTTGGVNVTTALALTLDGGSTAVSTRHESSLVGRTISVWDVGVDTSMPDVIAIV